MTGVFDDHLSLDAIVAYADGEMGLTAYQRAAAHVMRCSACAADVSEQTVASDILRHAALPSMPGSLFDSLRSIPLALPQARPVPGVELDSGTGVLVRTQDTGMDQDTRMAGSGSSRGRRFRLGAGALVAGLAVGALVVAAGDHPLPARPGPASGVVSSVTGKVVPRTFVNAAVHPATTRTTSTG